MPISVTLGLVALGMVSTGSNLGCYLGYGRPRNLAAAIISAVLTIWFARSLL